MYSPIRFSENDRVDTESNEINILTNDKVCGFDLNNSQMSVQKNQAKKTHDLNY